MASRTRLHMVICRARDHNIFYFNAGPRVPASVWALVEGEIRSDGVGGSGI